MIDRFENLFKIWGINDFQNFYESLSPKFNRNMIFKAGEGAGRSGSFFFFSHDQKFVVKTMTSAELRLVKKMMPAYEKHLTENKDSLLAKIMGIFTVEAANFSKVHIMLMENNVRLKDPKNLKYVFDLKGSSVNRTVTGVTKKSTTLKDINFLVAKQKVKYLTKLDQKTTKRLVNAMRSDVAFLKGMGIMDYSLLIAIEKSEESKDVLHFENAFENFDLHEGFVLPPKTSGSLNSQSKNNSTERSSH